MIQNIESLNPEAKLYAVANQVRGFLQREIEVDPARPNERVAPECSIKSQGAVAEANAGIKPKVVRIVIVISLKTIEGLLLPWIESLYVTGQLIRAHQLRITCSRRPWVLRLRIAESCSQVERNAGLHEENRVETPALGQ